MLAGTVSQSSNLAATRYPHIIFRDVLGAEAVAGLLEHVAAREADTRQTVLRNRGSGQFRVDLSVRKSLSIRDLGRFRAPLEAFAGKVRDTAPAEFGIAESALEPKEFLLQAYRDGDHFKPHIDTNELQDKVRVLSCVYYFAVTPRAFGGGELRLYELPTLSAAKRDRPLAFIDITPVTDTMVVFPSWLRHEVLPVSVPSGAWLDSRFTANCWLHRVPPAQATT